MYIEKLWLEDFRNYETAELSFPTQGLTLITGVNGQGKTNLLEAIAYVATLRSFRAATSQVMVRAGADRSVVRAEGERNQRRLLIESEIAIAGRSRVQINRQPLRKARDIGENLTATVFSPDDLELIKGGPAERRRYIDELLADSNRKIEALQTDLDRVIRQRNTLLKQSGGRLSSEIESTLDVWDSKLAELGEPLGEARQDLVERLSPEVISAYRQLVADELGPQTISLQMTTDWRKSDGGRGLLAELTESRRHDLARGITTVGPHRDELLLSINGLPARTQASQGEQRSLALSLRMASHALLRATHEAPPILLLDDVFSELDSQRARRLLEALPPGQAFLTTATGAPDGSRPDHVIRVEKGAAK